MDVKIKDIFCTKKYKIFLVFQKNKGGLNV